MKKRIPTLLATMIATALYSQQGLAADLASQCMLGVPSYDRPLVQGDTNDLPVTINAVPTYRSNHGDVKKKTSESYNVGKESKEI